MFIVRGLSPWAYMYLQCVHLLPGRQTRDSAYHPTARVSVQSCRNTEQKAWFTEGTTQNQQLYIMYMYIYTYICTLKIFTTIRVYI